MLVMKQQTTMRKQKLAETRVVYAVSAQQPKAQEIDWEDTDLSKDIANGQLY